MTNEMQAVKQVNEEPPMDTVEVTPEKLAEQTKADSLSRLDTMLSDIRAMHASGTLTGFVMLATTADGQLHQSTLPGQHFGTTLHMFELHKGVNVLQALLGSKGGA